MDCRSVLSRANTGPIFSYKLRYIVGFELVEMAISTNPKSTIYLSLYENTRPRLQLSITGFLKNASVTWQCEPLSAQLSQLRENLKIPTMVLGEIPHSPAVAPSPIIHVKVKGQQYLYMGRVTQMKKCMMLLLFNSRCPYNEHIKWLGLPVNAVVSHDVSAKWKPMYIRNTAFAHRDWLYHWS